MAKNKENNTLTEFTTFDERHTFSDEQYWKLFAPKKIDSKERLELACGNGENHDTLHNHDISMDVSITFKNMNGVIFQSKEKNINCNISEIDLFIHNLKKLIRTLDETKGDSIGDGSGGF